MNKDVISGLHKADCNGRRFAYMQAMILIFLMGKYMLHCKNVSEGGRARTETLWMNYEVENGQISLIM